MSNSADPELERELTSAIAEAVARFGMAGEVLIEGTDVRLVGAGPEAVTELGHVLEQWSGLAPELRQRRATEIARRLVAARRSSLAPSDKRRSFNPLGYLAPVAILAVAAVALYFAYRYFSPGGSGEGFSLFGTRAPSATGPRNVDEYEAERTQRAQRACEATRARVQRGATVGPSDVEGWVVEMVFLRAKDTPDPVRDPGLVEFVEKREDAGARFAWKGTPDLAALDGITTSVSVAEEPNKGFRGLRLTFEGQYVASYFHAGTSRYFIKAAAAVAEKLNMRYGALYARCAHTDTHHLGAWFLGPNPAGAAASLVYFMGAFNDPPQLRNSVMFPQGGNDVRSSEVIARVEKGFGDIDRVKLRNLIGEHGGMISGQKDGPTALTFPFSDGNRASRGSHSLTKVAGVGLER
jgi:serine/threonine-protein kinase